MFSIAARTKFLDLSKSFKSMYVVAVGILLTIISYIFYQNIIVTVTMTACTVASYIIASQPTKEILVSLDEDGINVDDEIITWENLVAWAMVDLGDKLEFIISTNNFVKDYYFFYIDSDLPEVVELITLLTQYLAYNTEIIAKNRTHTFLRTVGLK